MINQLLINGWEKVAIENLRNTKTFIVYENLNDYNPKKKMRELVVLDGMIADIKSNKRISPIVFKLFLWGRSKTRKWIKSFDSKHTINQTSNIMSINKSWKQFK